MDYFKRNKRDADFLTGKIKREEVTKNLNFFLEKNETGLKFERLHKFIKSMGIYEKAKNNVLKNTIYPAPFTSAMSLHYVLINTSLNHKIPFIFGFCTGGGFYLKVPKEYKVNSQEFVELLIKLNYHVIIIDKINFYSLPISMKTINQYWKHSISDAKGNKNRLQFFGKIKSITYSHPEGISLLGDGVIKNLQKLMR